VFCRCPLEGRRWETAVRELWDLLQAVDSIESLAVFKRLPKVPTVIVDSLRVACLRAQGLGWKAIEREMSLRVGTVLRAAQQVAKTLVQKTRAKPYSPSDGLSTSARMVIAVLVGKPDFSAISFIVNGSIFALGNFINAGSRPASPHSRYNLAPHAPLSRYPTRSSRDPGCRRRHG